MMNTQRMVAISHDDFVFLNNAADRTGQPIAAVVHALIERALRDREANGRLALQVSALVDLHALGADDIIEKTIASERGRRGLVMHQKISVRLSSDDAAYLATLQTRHGGSMSDVIRNLIEQVMAQESRPAAPFERESNTQKEEDNDATND